MELKNQSALVTGGSEGLGYALACALAQRGARVVITARGVVKLQASVASLRERGLDVHGLRSDMADKTAIYPLAAQCAALIGPIAILINNASTLGLLPLQPLAETDCEDLEQTLRVNLIGPFRLTKAVLGSMALRRRGVIVNISSDAAVEAYPSWGAYGTSKAALDQLTRIWAQELAPEAGVRIFSVDPGEMDTRMHAAALPDADRSQLAAPATVAEQIVQMIADPEHATSGARLSAQHWRHNHDSAA